MIEKYALAISPAWKLTDMRIMSRRNSALLIGLEKVYLDKKTNLYFPKLNFVKIELRNVGNRLRSSGYYHQKLENPRVPLNLCH